MSEQDLRTEKYAGRTPGDWQKDQVAGGWNVGVTIFLPGDDIPHWIRIGRFGAELGDCARAHDEPNAQLAADAPALLADRDRHAQAATILAATAHHAAEDAARWRAVADGLAKAHREYAIALADQAIANATWQGVGSARTAARAKEQAMNAALDAYDDAAKGQPAKFPPMQQTLDRIHAAGGKAWDDVDDPEAAVAEMKGQPAQPDATVELVEACRMMKNDLGNAEWSCDAHAAEMFQNFIDQYHSLLTAALAKVEDKP